MDTMDTKNVIRATVLTLLNEIVTEGTEKSGVELAKISYRSRRSYGVPNWKWDLCNPL
jgi:hypothetical protein